jgi:hypothetical protein
MTVTPEQQGRNDTRSDASAANLFEGGALGFMDRVGDAMTKRFDEMYSSENLHKMMDKALENLPPEIREGLSQLFNALSGALSGNDPAKSQEYETIKEVYGTGGTDNEAVRMASNFAQRDDAQFAAAVTIGNGSGAITEVNGIQYVNGKPVNDSDDDDAEALEEMADQMERERKWSEETHRFGDVEMSGDEWEELSEQLSGNTPLRKRMIERLMAQGQSQKQAEETVDKAAEVSHIMNVPESQRTPEQRRILTEAEKKPGVAQVIKWGAEARSNEVSRDESYAPMGADRNVSVQNRTDAFASDIDLSGAGMRRSISNEGTTHTFPSAPDLTAAHAKAVAATEPLERGPQQIAAATVKPPAPAANMSGLDV